MKPKNKLVVTFGLLAACVVVSNLALECCVFPSAAAQAQAAPAAVAATKKIGVIKAIDGASITLAPDAGPEIAVSTQSASRIVRIAPGEKDLKNAVPLQLQDLQVGDRVLVAGKASDDAKSIAASSIVVMKHSDVEARQEQERQDWQKRGLGGLVKSVDVPSGTVTISVTGFGGSKSVDIHASKVTVIRRYAADSVKFDNAKSSSLKEIQPGDQLRARGDRTPDGTSVAAEEIVTGSFRNVAGTVISVDASSGTVSVQDLLSKKSVQVKVTQESQLHKLPVEMAQRIATRLKGSMPPGMPGAGTNASAASPGTSAATGQPGSSGGYPGAGASASTGASANAGGPGGGMRSGGAPDFQQMLSRMPAVALADLHKGDAVLIVATEGSATSGGTAITLLSGVEPILQAAPSGSQAMMLTPWSLGGAPGGGDAGSQ
jgi:co-chaperonin GroES (HSP10)